MPDASGHPNPPKPVTPPPLPGATGAQPPTPPLPPRIIPPAALPKLPTQAELPIATSTPPPVPAPAAPPAPAPVPADPATPPPVPATTAPDSQPESKSESLTAKPGEGQDRPKPKGLAFPKFSMLSKKPGELLSRKRGKTVPAPGSDTKPGEKLPAPALPSSTPAAAPQSIQKVTLDPQHKGGSNRAHAEKLPHPRELSATPAVPGETAPKTPLAPMAGVPVQVPKKEVHRVRPAWLKIIIAVTLRLLVLAAIVGLGYYSYYTLRETRLEGFVNLPPGFQVKRVCLVRDFRQDVLNLAEELAMARAPLSSDIDQLESVVSRSKSDVAGRDERLRLLREEVEKADKEILGVMKDATESGNKIWAGPGAALDVDFAQKKEEFHKKIVERAAQLRIKYVDNTDFRDPEVWVNAFRLALYDAPKEINTTAQREWAEKELNGWKKYVESYQQSMTALKKQVEEIQTSPQGRIGEINQRVADLNQRIGETEQEITPIRQELKQGQEALDKLKAEQASLESPFYKQVLDAPEGSLLLKLNFDPETNRFSWREINRDPQFPPGEYNLWVSAIAKDGQEYWTYVPIHLYQYQTTQIILQPGAFVSVQTILRSGTGTEK